MIYEGLTETEKPNKRLRDITLEGRHFNEIANSVKASTSDAEPTEVTNSLYKPEVVEYLLPHTMPYVRMWSGIASPTKSNALVENLQRIVKETVINRRVTESEFIASMYEEHQSRALEVLCRIKSNKKKNKNDRSPLKEEKWAKRQPSKVKPYAHRNLCDVASNYIKKSESRKF